MKTSKFFNKIIAAGIVCCSVGLSSCDDFLTVLPSNKITEEDFWKSEGDLQNVRAAAYRQMASSSVTSRIYYWGEMRSDNVTLYDQTQTNLANLQKAILMPTDGMFDWSAFYTGINYCNLVLEQGEAMTDPGNEVDPSFRRSDWKPIETEMKALRALYYFYLVRAYRNVPYVTAAVRTDAEARARVDGATQGVNILGRLTEELEEALPYAANDYGTSTDNTGRFTDRGVRALLADMYLWRGCMLLNSSDKGDVVVSADGDTLSGSQLTTLSKECFTKAIEHCDYIMAYMDSVYEQDKKVSGNTGQFGVQYNYTPLRDDYPYMTMSTAGTFTAGTDNLVASLMANSNSDEHVFQLKYDANAKVTNGAGLTYYSYINNSALATSYVTGSGTLSSSVASTYNPERGFGKSDLRLLEDLNYTSGSTSLPQIHKHVINTLTVSDFSDVSKGGKPSYYSSNEANFPIYRLTDIMLIKAECIARSMSSSTKASTTTTDAGYALVEGFKLVNSVFARYNPKLTASESYGSTKDLQSDRLRTDYATISSSVKTAADLLTLVYNERQREFVFEGKRWFDIVRECEATNDNSDVLTNYINLSTTVRNRLRKLYSLYCPIYSEEIKVNGVDYGGNLEQNPVWDRYTTK